MLKYFWPIKSLTFYTGLICVLAISLILAHYSYAPKSSCQITFELETPVPVDFGIYYDIGHGLTQKDHQIKTIETINERTSVSFCISVFTQLRTIRFDPATEPVYMSIYGITLAYDDGTVYKVPFDSLKPGEQILKHSTDDSGFHFETQPDADDPIFTLTKLRDGIQKNGNINKTAFYALWIFCGLIFTLLGKFFILYFVKGK